MLDERVEVFGDAGGRNGMPSLYLNFGEFQGLQTVAEGKSTNSTTSPIPFL